MYEQAPDHQAAYWDRVADEKRFTHPLRWDWIEAALAQRASAAPPIRVLDLGCG